MTTQNKLSLEEMFQLAERVRTWTYCPPGIVGLLSRVEYDYWGKVNDNSHVCVSKSDGWFPKYVLRVVSENHIELGRSTNQDSKKVKKLYQQVTENYREKEACKKDEAREKAILQARKDLGDSS